jgi:hypothetical protein
VRKCEPGGLYFQQALSILWTLSKRRERTQ